MKQTIKEDIHKAFSSYNGFFHNEKEIQIFLTKTFIDSKKYDNVFFEYYVSTDLIKNFIWNNEKRISIDIVLEKDSLYYPIEIKFKTKNQTFPHTVFGTNVKVTLENHGAYTNSRYDFWKDVKRIELLEDNFDNVRNGIVVFVTNDLTYIDPPKRNNGGTPFAIYRGKEVIANLPINWEGNLRTAQKRCGLTFNYTYVVNWFPMKILNHFYTLS